MPLKWIKFSDKFPHLDTNVLVTSDGNDIGIIKWDIVMQRAWRLSVEKNEYAECFFYNVDPEYDNAYDLTVAEYWAYPTNLLSNKKAFSNKNIFKNFTEGEMPCGCRYIKNAEFGHCINCHDPIHRDFQL